MNGLGWERSHNGTGVDGKSEAFDRSTEGSKSNDALDRCVERLSGVFDGGREGPNGALDRGVETLSGVFDRDTEGLNGALDGGTEGNSGALNIDAFDRGIEGLSDALDRCEKREYSRDDAHLVMCKLQSALQDWLIANREKRVFKFSVSTVIRRTRRINKQERGRA